MVVTGKLVQCFSSYSTARENTIRWKGALEKIIGLDLFTHWYYESDNFPVTAFL